ncbi:MAG: LamG-like jellyroll fold domain-containing protein [Planctomycetota bacterium]|jgi:hypothetical protein
MAGRDAIAFALSSVLCLATHGLAADTGMLYVKSDPPGATVVIEGKKRGKTPVLVKGLAPGEVTVEVRIAGVKPVTKVAAVKASKVATIDVAIEVPSATLTIVSEPLEATVFMDNQEVGKTPLTLEDLAPGRHQLILLKEGHPRTARSVVLKPGAERVLEVKLGTTGEDETKRPAAGASVAQAAKSVPIEVQLIFTMLKDAVAKGNYSETRKNLALGLSQPDMADFKKELRAAIGVVQALEAREDAIRDGADALVGKEVVLKTKTGTRKGKVESVSVEGIAIVSKIVVARRAAGETRAVIKWSALAPEEQDRLAVSWKPEGLDGTVARALLAIARKDKAGAERAVRAAGEHSLGKYLGAGSPVAAKPVEDDPTKIWARIEKKYRARRVTAAEEVALDREIRVFKDRYGKAGIDASLRRRMRLAAERAKRMSGLVGHWTFDEGGGSVARDWSGRGHHGRIKGGVRWRKGKIGAALAFDGVNDYVTVRQDSVLEPSNAITVALWAYATNSHAGTCADLVRKAGPHQPGYLLRWSHGDGRLQFRFGSTPPTVVADAQPNSAYLNAWHHFAATYDSAGGVARLYVDGALRASMTGLSGSIRHSDDLFIMGQDIRSHGSIPGAADDVRIYNRALSAEEVKTLATAGE